MTLLRVGCIFGLDSQRCSVIALRVPIDKNSCGITRSRVPIECCGLEGMGSEQKGDSVQKCIFYYPEATCRGFCRIRPQTFGSLKSDPACVQIASFLALHCKYTHEMCNAKSLLLNHARGGVVQETVTELHKESCRGQFSRYTLAPASRALKAYQMNVYDVCTLAAAN